MTLEKVHQKLQLQAVALIKSLNAFTDQNIQPCVEECEQLQNQLVVIQENLAVYKFQKSSKEISPSFQIHSKVSAVEPIVKEENNQATLGNTGELAKQENAIEKKTESLIAENNQNIVQTPPPIASIEITEQTQVKETPKSDQKQSIKPLAVALNDKFRFINELFLHNAAEYNIAIEQINNLNSWHECDLYLNSLKQLYNWQDQNEVAKQLFAVVKKRFE